MSFPNYSDYQSSGIEWLGDVPSHWKVMRLKHVALVNMGQSPDSNDYTDSESPGALPFLQGNAEFGSANPTAKIYCQTAKKYARAGDILLSVRAPVGALNVADRRYGIGRGLCSVAPHTQTSRNLLSWLLHAAEQAFDSIATGSTFEAVSAEQVENLSLSISLSVEEQTQIARFLDHETARIDALIAEQERLIELLGEKRQAVISHAVTKGLDPDAPMTDSGVEWLGEVPAHWAVLQFRRVMEGQTLNGLYKSKQNHDPAGTSFIQMGETFKDRVYTGGSSQRVKASPSELKKWGLDEGDLLFARRSIVKEGSGRCTRIGLLQEPHIFESSMIRVRLDRKLVAPKFIHHLLDSSVMRAQTLATTKTVTISGIDSSQLKTLKGVCPPLHEQRELTNYIDNKVEELFDLKRHATESIELLKERRSALISAAVTGKIDVRDWQPPASETQPLSAQPKEVPA